MGAVGGGQSGAQRRHEARNLGYLDAESNVFLSYPNIGESLVPCPKSPGLQPADYGQARRNFPNARDA